MYSPLSQNFREKGLFLLSVRPWWKAGQAPPAAEEELRARLPGWFLTDRFSPGYGDLPLCIQPEVCAALDAGRRVGIHVSDSFLMNPMKSVTAVIGIADRPQMARVRGCAYCAMAASCRLRKGGKHCGI